MESDAEYFVGMADPHAWLITADNLHEQALGLYRRRGGGVLRRFGPDGSSTTWDIADRSIFLLGGFALENAIKAFLVYENPHWVSNGTLAKPLRSHALVALRARSNLIPYRTRLTWVLRQFEEGLETWARYPCGLTAESTADQRMISEELWAGYLRLMASYGNNLKKLLGRGWNGPHGRFGRWEIRGEYLSIPDRPVRRPTVARV